MDSRHQVKRRTVIRWYLYNPRNIKSLRQNQEVTPPYIPL